MSHLKLPPYRRPICRKNFGSVPVQGTTSYSNSPLNPSFRLIGETSSLVSKNSITMTDKLPDDISLMEYQVAGHFVQVGSDQIGMLRCNDGSVLKPEGSPMCAAREIKFYQQLMTSTDLETKRLIDFTSEYLGTQTLNIGHKQIKFIKLRDLTYGMLQPCVMDLKMGPRTYDPLANEEKKRNEESKYILCKSFLGFCCPGFQSFDIASKNYKKYGREYGKNLDQHTMIEAIRAFLNAETGLSRQLVTLILTSLWAIQNWMRTQTSFKFFSSSILIVYDAHKLQEILKSRELVKSSIAESNSTVKEPGEIVGNALIDVCQQKSENLKRSASFGNNHEWVQVKMIDFAHTFTNAEIPESCSKLDQNYLKGIESLVKIFEDILKSCDGD